MAVYIQRYETPVYRAVYTFYAIPQGEESIQSARMLARDCARLTHTNTFRQAVLKSAASDGQTSVDVQAVDGTHMLEVSAVGPDSQIVHNLANAVGVELCDRLPRMFHAQGVKEIERAALPAEPFVPFASARIAAAALAAFVVMSLLVCCIPGGKEKLSCFCEEADEFRLGAVGDTRRLTRRYLKKAHMGGMLLQQADRFIREDIRQLVLVLRTTMSQEAGCSLVLTSMHPDEEETALTVLLASEMAQQGFRVLLMEMSTQKPTLSELLGVKARADMHDYLAGRAELGEVIQHTQLKNLSFVDSLHPGAGVADLAATPAFGAFIRNAEAHFDFVILRTDSRAASSDASMLGLVTSSTLLLVRDEAYTLDEIQAAAREMVRLGKPAKGVVFTRVRAQ